MDFYIDVKYREVYNRTFPWLRKQKVYCIDAVHVSFDKKGYRKRTIITKRLYKTHVEMRRAIERFIMENWYDHKSIRLFSIGWAQSMLFYSLFDNAKPHWLPAGVIDIDAYADYYIYTRIDFAKLVENNKIDFMPTRCMSIPEIREVIKLHVDYPKNGNIIQRHKFYTELEQQL